MDIQHKVGESKGSFFIEENSEVKAEITYSKASPSLVIIDHNEVSYELRGENIGKRLVEHTVNYTRENKLRIIPLCPFAKSVIDRDNSLQDVLKR